MNNDSDEEKLSFIHIAAVTANVIRFLKPQKKKDEESRSDNENRKADEEKAERQRRYVDQRLKDLVAFERRVSRRD